MAIKTSATDFSLLRRAVPWTLLHGEAAPVAPPSYAPACGVEKSGVAIGFSPRNCDFACQYHSTTKLRFHTRIPLKKSKGQKQSCSHARHDVMSAQWRYNSTRSQPRHQRDVTGQHHAHAASPAARSPSTHQQEARWSQEIVWTFRRRDKALTTAEIQKLGRPARSQVIIQTTLSHLLTEKFGWKISKVVLLHFHIT